LVCKGKVLEYVVYDGAIEIQDGHNTHEWTTYILSAELGQWDVKNQGAYMNSKHGIRGKIVWTNYYMGKQGWVWMKTNGRFWPNMCGWIPRCPSSTGIARTLKWGWIA